MDVLKHCDLYWTVTEKINLKPAKLLVEKGIVSQVLLYAKCDLNKKDPHPVYCWYPVYKDGTTGERHTIKPRKFENEWRDRLKTDIQEEYSIGKAGKGRHLIEIKKPSHETIQYLTRKEKFAARLKKLPEGKTAAEIYS